MSVRNWILEKIRSGAYTPGMRIPSYRELAELAKVPPSTMNVALRKLVKEGVLVRYHGSGTYVREPAGKLNRIAFYMAGDTLLNSKNQYIRLLVENFKDILNRNAKECHIIADTRPNDKLKEPLQELVDLIASRQIDAIAAAGLPFETLSWIRKFPVPEAFVSGNEEIPCRVDYDDSQFYHLAVKYLADKGCRSIGFISPSLDSAEFRAKSFSRLKTEAEKNKIFLDMDAVVSRKMAGGGKFSSHERFGHDALLYLWSLKKRPDGIIISPDSVATGVILGILEKNISVPSQLKIATHKNREMDMICPFPIGKVVTEIGTAAEALYALLQKQADKKKVEPVYMGFEIEA